MTTAGEPLDASELPALRSATVRRDRAAVEQLLTGRDPAPLLQHAGDALLAVGVPGLEEADRRVEEALRARDDEGDVELADTLAALLGGAAPLRSVTVDLEDVAVLMSDNEHGGGWVDLATGETWPEFVLENLDEDQRPDMDADPARWWWVASLGSRAAWRDRRDFADTLPDGPQRDRLLDALDGRGAFRRFSRVLDDDATALTRWRAFGDERERGRARAAMVADGLTPVPRTLPS